MGSKQKSFVRRVPGGILGGIGVVSVLSGAIDLHSQVLTVIHAYQAVTRPIWDYTIGTVLQMFGWSIPDLVKDYLTMGIIVSVSEFMAIARNSYVERRSRNVGVWKSIISILRVMFIDMYFRPVVSFLLWPFVIVSTVLSEFWTDPNEEFHTAITSPIRSWKRGMAGYRALRYHASKTFYQFIFWAILIIMVSFGLDITNM